MASTGWVSGSPNRALIRHPQALEVVPTRRTADRRRVSRWAISAMVGSTTCAMIIHQAPGAKAACTPSLGVGAGVAVTDPLEVWAGCSGSAVRPSVIAKSDTSVAGTPRQPRAEHPPRGRARRPSDVTMTPLPAARPSCDDVRRPEPIDCLGDLVDGGAVDRLGGGDARRGRLFLGELLGTLNRAASADGRSTGFRRHGRRPPPATSGASGPTTTRLAPTCAARFATATPSSGSMPWFVAMDAVPGLPGAQWIATTDGSRLRASASACSLPPLPTTRTVSSRFDTRSAYPADDRDGGLSERPAEGVIISSHDDISGPPCAR